MREGGKHLNSALYIYVQRHEKATIFLKTKQQQKSPKIHFKTVYKIRGDLDLSREKPVGAPGVSPSQV